MSYLIQYSYQGAMGIITDTMLIRSATSFDDEGDLTSACAQIKNDIPSATNFINKTK